MKNGRSIARAGRAALVALSLLTGTGAALAQQPAPPPPAAAQPAPGRPAPGQPAGAQPMPMPMPAQPGQGLPMGHPPIQPPTGRPGGPGMPGMPGMPGGTRPQMPAFNPHAAPGGQGAAAHKEPKPEHCPGHGPMDRPPMVNWWHGLLMVNNKRASEGGFFNTLLFRYDNDENPCDPKNEPPPFLAAMLNFGLLAFIIYKFGRKPLAESLANRKQSIMKEIDTATTLLDEAEERLAEYEKKFERLEQTSEELKAELKTQAEVEKNHLLAEAEERKARMKRDAEFRIEQELKAAKAELLQRAVENAVVAAEELLKKSAGSQDQDRMNKDYLSAIPIALKTSGLSSTSSSSAGAAEGRS